MVGRHCRLHTRMGYLNPMPASGWRIAPGALECPLVIAHRGGAGAAPENTLAAFRHALETGCDGVELDVRLTRDKEAVVIHDRRLERTTDGSGFVGAHTMDQLRELDAGAWFSSECAGEKPPSLDEVFRELPDDFLIYVEIKAWGPSVRPLTRRVVELVRSHRRLETTMVASFNPAVLLCLRMMDSCIVRGCIYSARQPLPLRRRWMSPLTDPHWYAPAQGSIDEPTVRSHQADGRAVAVWDLDTEEDMEAPAKWGVDAVVTDYPGLYMERMSRL